MVEEVFFHVLNSRPSDRVISPFITSSPGTSECVGPFRPSWSPGTSESVRPRVRPRPPSPGQSSPSSLCPVPCPCALLCCLSCVLLGVCPCFLYSLFSCSRLCSSVFLAACPSQLCVWSCQGVVMSRFCFPKMLYALNPPQQKALIPQSHPSQHHKEQPTRTYQEGREQHLETRGWEATGVLEPYAGED